MDYRLPNEVAKLREEALAVGTAVAQGRERGEDSWLVGSDEPFARELGRRGWLGMTWPKKSGGHGRSPLERFVVFEALISTGAPVASSWLADRQIGPTLLNYGSFDQQRQFLPDIVAGKGRWCLGLSEPDAGSDIAGIKTRATLDGDDWVINGQKIWTSFATEADWCYLVARTNPTAPSHEALSEIIVPLKSPGVTVRPIRDMSDGEHFCELFFDNVRVPKSHLVGTLHGSFRQVMRQMEFERGGIDRLLSNYALFVDVLPLADTTDRTVRAEIAKLHSGYTIGRHLVLREVLGQAPRNFSALTKTFCTELEQQVSDFCGRVLGMEAVAPTTTLGRRAATNLVYAPAYTLMGGTTQILRNILAERLLGLPRA